MKTIFKAIHRDSKGFTLVELIIVFALLAILAAIVIPNVTNLTGYGQDQAADAELSIVQTAMDVMMAKTGVASVTPTSGEGDMTAFPASPSTPLYPDYLRFATTHGTYNCDDTGLVSTNTTGYEP